MEEELQAVRMVLRGRVQGVGFRAAAQEEARTIDLRGWIRNESDGSVRIVAAGTPSQLEAFRRWCRSGPALARVDDIDEQTVDAAKDLPHPFAVRR